MSLTALGIVALLLSHMLSVASLPRMPISSVHFVHLLAYSSCWRGCIYLSAGLESPWETCSCRIACVCPLHPITTRGSGHQWHMNMLWPASWVCVWSGDELCGSVAGVFGGSVSMRLGYCQTIPMDFYCVYPENKAPLGVTSPIAGILQVPCPVYTRCASVTLGRS